jgi:hypothetical protein
MPTPTTDTPSPELLTLSTHRTALGLTLELRSQIFEDFFRGLQPSPQIRREQGDGYGGVPYYDLPRGTFTDFAQGDLFAWGSRELIVHGRPNISFLRAAGLGAGVSITVRAPFSRKQQQEFMQKLEVAATDFHLEYIREENRQLQITVHHIDEAVPSSR